MTQRVERPSDGANSLGEPPAGRGATIPIFGADTRAFMIMAAQARGGYLASKVTKSEQINLRIFHRYNAH
jgi:hypothetical protein